MRHAPLNQGVYFAPRQPAWVNIFPPRFSKLVSALLWAGVWGAWSGGGVLAE